MLPFLRRKEGTAASLIIKQRSPDASKEADADPRATLTALEAEAHSFLHAVETKDPKAMAISFRAMMECCGLEGPEEDKKIVHPHTYEAQNEIAGEE